MRKTVVINVVGLSARLLSRENTPQIWQFMEKGAKANINPVLPAVTCTAQATYLTGTLPDRHGIVGNGWYFEEECEVKFWRQSNKLVGERKIWEALREEVPGFTCLNAFWWYNMYSSVDYSITPRPNYLADGRKIPDIYTFPAELRDSLQESLGRFPLFNFWGPRTSIKASQWIADATMAADQRYDPTLSLIYLPHLDYNLQRYGNDFPGIGKDLNEIDAVVGKLILHYQNRQANIVLLSEYGITNVVRPVHLNRVLRQQGLLTIREERGLELLDAGASRAFAVADHQVAHVYVNDKGELEKVRGILEGVPGVDEVLDRNAQSQRGIGHPRSGDFLVIAAPDSWFTYYFWEADRKAPDFARMVDIHKKPGYDPVELFTDPSDPLVGPRVAVKLLAKKLGFRTVLNIIPLKAELVGGSHGRVPESEEDYPIFITNRPDLLKGGQIQPTEVYAQIWDHVVS